MSTPEERLEVLFQNAKAYLMTTTKDGVSVYDQLTRLMETLLDGDAEEMLKDPTKFNEIMATLEQHSFTQGESTLTSNEPSKIPPQELQRLNQNRTLFERAPPQVQTVIEQPDPYTTITTTTSKPMSAPKYDTVMQQNAFWSAANGGLAESEAFLLDRSITRLAMEKNLKEIRFVGKIFGTKGNYYVVSTQRYVKEGEKVYKEVNTMPKPPRKKCVVAVQPEPGYVGCNRLSFWVSSFPSAEWELLPDVTPQQINASRAIKRLFTGNLEAEVVSSPPFPWSEAVYLRSQLSRIVSSTFIAPQGALEEAEEAEEEENENEDEDEEAAKKPKEAKYRPLTVRSKEYGEDPVDVAGLASLDQWVHAEGYIYNNGRQTKVPEPPEKEEAEGEAEEEEEQEPQEDEEEPEEEQEEPEEEEDRELFAPIRNDFLYGVVDIPQPPPQVDEDEEEEEVEETKPEEPPKEDNNPVKPLREEDVRDDDPTKMKIASWTARLVNKTAKAHRVAVVESLRWPGAFAYIGDSGKQWGCVYFGNGLKKTDSAFTPIPAPPIQSECADIVEYADPTAATEKLVRRGEEPPEPDSEQDMEEAEDEDQS